MGSFPIGLAKGLRDTLSLRRAVETGTHQGHTARMLAEEFQEVVTVELSDRYYGEATDRLADLTNLTIVHGESGLALTEIEANVPTLYWLDAHWSGGETAKAEVECPVLEEIAAIGPGHPDDCIIIDDARLFAVTPDPEQWPTLPRLFELLARHRPEHHVTLLHDMVIAVPRRAKALVDEWGRKTLWEIVEAAEGPRGAEPPPAGGRTRLARLRRRLSAD